MNYIDILRRYKLKVTPARESILSIFSDECKPVDADSIFRRLKGKSIDQATIYRNLITLEKIGLIKKVDLHKDSLYYELSESHHHHIVCNKCGLVESFDNCSVDHISEDILKKSSKFKRIDQHSFEFFGLCKLCLK